MAYEDWKNASDWDEIYEDGPFGDNYPVGDNYPIDAIEQLQRDDSCLAEDEFFFMEADEPDDRELEEFDWDQDFEDLM